MTIPTQAQIEAALLNAANALDDCRQVMAALTAAAQVGEPEAAYRFVRNTLTLQPTGRLKKEIADINATAAAQVGEQVSQDIRGECFDLGWEKAIERCAQVLDELANLSSGMAQGAYRNGAAAIRKLKDEP